MTADQPFGGADWAETLASQAEGAWDRFEAAWRAGQRPQIEDYLSAVREAQRTALLRELLVSPLTKLDLNSGSCYASVCPILGPRRMSHAWS